MKLTKDMLVKNNSLLPVLRIFSAAFKVVEHELIFQ
jgi:hypothetical protein